MRENFGRCLALVLKHEGGYVDHPQDPGGATNKGITIATFRGYFGNNRLTKDDLKNITDETVGKIYKARYWDAVKGDDLPLGLDYAVFDFGVNSGPSRSIKFLQTAIGATPDGVIGPATMRAIAGYGARQAIVSLCAARLTWLQGLKTWATFGRGWGRRVAEVEDAALGMVGIRQPAPPIRHPEPPQATGAKPPESPVSRPAPPVIRRPEPPQGSPEPEDAIRGDDPRLGPIAVWLRRWFPFLFRTA